MELSKTGVFSVSGENINENLVTNTSSEWSNWVTPAANGTNQTSNQGVAELPANKNVGDKYSCSVEIEFNGVTAGTGGTFAFRAQGSSDSGWVGGNPWGYLMYSGTVPADGIYTFNWTGTINSASVDDTRFNCGFRADYWGSGKYRVRFVKMEKGSTSTIWTPYESNGIQQGFIEGSNIFRVFDGHLEANEFIEF